MEDVRTIKERFERAIERDRTKEAIELLDTLERLEPDKARWPQRRGDIWRKNGKRADAVAAYERAVGLYAAEGFIARAVALARLVADLDPTRADLLERIDPRAAQKLIVRPAMQMSRAPVTLPQPKSVPPPTSSIDDIEIEEEISVFDLSQPASDVEIEIDLTDVEVEPRARPKAGTPEPTADDLASLPAFPLFAEAPREALVALVRGADLVELAHGEIVIRQGTPSDEMYAIVEGAVRVVIPGLEVEAQPILGEGEVFGESCLLENEPRKADVVVDGRLFALRIPRAVLRQVVAAHPAAGDILFSLLTRRLVSNLMQSSPLFTAFDPATRKELARMFEVRRGTRGQTILEEGKKSAGLFVPLTGRVELRSKARQIADVAGPGAVLGQDTLLTQGPSEFTVTCAKEMALLCLPSSSFGGVASQYPPVLAHLADLAAKDDSTFTMDGLLG